MAQHDAQVIALRGLREQFAEDRDRVVVASEAREYRGAKKSGLGIGRRGPQPLVDLLQRRRILLALNQNAYEIQPRGGVTRRAVHHFAEKALGLICRAASLRDPAEQAQRLDMPSLPGDVARQKVFCRHMLAVAEPTARLDDRGRQLLQLRKVLRHNARSLRLAGCAQQSFQHRPTRRQGRIQFDRAFE